ncbi:RTA1 like protein-domain-containing protein [Tricladium varicosporioides]|nr:RTA1 like protein-domain-containing protein [Hymenoscyphus varicosporioides]
MAGEYVDGSIWFYAPNKVLPIIWTTFFAMSCITHIWQCIHFQAWKFTGLLPFSTLVFVAGYIIRVLGAYNYTNITYYIVSVCTVYGAPPLYELANYIILGRILYYIPYYSPLNPGRVLTTFGFLSAIVESFNGWGASLLSNVKLSQSKQDLGHNLLRAGLAIQLFVLASFTTLAIYFQRKCKKHGLMPKHLTSILTTLYISTALITIRTIYRTVEYFAASRIHVTPGFNPMSINPIIRYEWFFWVFEAGIMLVNSALLNFRHPAMYLPRSNKIYLAEDGETEILGPGYEDRRFFVITLIDPCDLIGLLQGQDKKERYWERHERIPPRPEQSSVSAAAVSATSKVNMEKEKGLRWWKRSPWSLFKEAFLMDRGNQGKELRMQGTATATGGDPNATAADVERDAGKGYQSQAGMAKPT